MADYYFVGDEFEGSPIELNRWISPIWAVGGRVELDGSTARVVYLPPSYHPEESILRDYTESFTNQIAPKIEPVVLVPEEEPVTLVVEDAPAPKPFTPRGRPKKNFNTEGKVN